MTKKINSQSVYSQTRQSADWSTRRQHIFDNQIQSNFLLQSCNHFC